jgi:hypothetical protein
MQNQYFWAVKFVLFFLCFIVLALTVMPCCACEDEVSDPKETSKSLSQGENTEKDDCCKDCSPFYVCGSCTGFVLLSQIPAISPCYAVKEVAKNGFYLAEKLPEIDLSIWQPPQLG